MKSKKILSIAVLALLFSVASSAAEKDSISLKSCTFVLKNATADVSLSYPQIVSTLAAELPLKDSLNRAVFATLSAYPPFDYTGQVFDDKTLELYCNAVAKKLEQYGRQASFDPIPFRFFSSWWAFGNEVVISVFLKQYSYAGGAHGYSNGDFLNFNPLTGEKIDLRDNIADTSLLLAIAANQFCIERRLPKNTLKIRTGLFCELSELPMPSQMGFSDKGMILYYNQYEIAPYSLGPIEITIPYKYFKDVLTNQFTLSKMRVGGAKIYNDNMKAEHNSERRR